MHPLILTLSTPDPSVCNRSHTVPPGSQPSNAAPISVVDGLLNESPSVEADGNFPLKAESVDSDALVLR